MPDVPKSMAWCENSICVGFKRDYYLIRVRTRFELIRKLNFLDDGSGRLSYMATSCGPCKSIMLRVLRKYWPRPCRP